MTPDDDTIADDMTSGLVCQECGEYFEDGAVGYPRTCTDCLIEDGEEPQ